MNNISSISTRIQSYGLAFALLILLVLLNYNPVSGVMRGGDEDEGSGIGGTGRMPVPSSESGFGGTGFKPFVGLNVDLEVEVQRTPVTQTDHPIQDIVASVEPLEEVQRLEIPAAIDAPVIAQEPNTFTTDSSAISITESIQRDFDGNALQMDQLRNSIATHIGRSSASEMQNISVKNQEFITDSSSLKSNLQPAENPSAKSTPKLSWSDVANYLSDALENDTADSSKLAALDNNTSARADRPSRIQRPELPPLQRARPLQRLSILPPQIKPLSL